MLIACSSPDMLVYIRLGAQALDGCRKLPGEDGQQALIGLAKIIGVAGLQC